MQFVCLIKNHSTQKSFFEYEIKHLIRTVKSLNCSKNIIGKLAMYYNKTIPGK